MRALPLAAASLALACLSPAARAETGRLGFELVAGKAPKIDGVLRDWPAPPSALTAGKSKGAVRVALAYDDDALYAAFDVSDERLVRTKGAGPDDDHASLSLAFPEPGARGRYATVELLLYPGDPGNLAGVVKDGQGAEIAAARLVEAPRRGGYTFEAKIPWGAIAQAARVRCGLRALVRFHDGDGGRARVAASSGPDGPAAEWTRLETEPERGLSTAFAREKKLGPSPQIDLVADVAGDALAERVLLWDHYLLVAGPRFRDGKQFYFNDLGEAAKPGALEVRDLTGDGKAEFVVRKRVERGERWSELLQVLSFRGDAVSTLFEHEIAAGAPGGEVSDEVRLLPEPGGGRIEIGRAKARGLTAASFGGAPDPKTGVLVPWGAVRTRTFRWKDGKFVIESEDRGQGGPVPSPEPAAKAAAAGAPRPPGPDELLDEVLALYRRDRRLRPGDRPRFDFVADVVGDARPERVLVFGRELVVFGNGFREGRGYASLSLGFTKADDVLDVGARDLDGDGHAELVVRGVREAPAPRELGRGTLGRELLFVYTVRGDQISRALGLETGLSFGARRVSSSLLFVPEGRGASLVIHPGRATGWAEASWPFRQGEISEGGLEPLLLPWAKGPRRYRWRGGALAREAD